MSILRNLIIVLIVLCSVGTLCGQGGPPMITDDPGTPGPNRWEINLAIAFERRASETSWQLPAIDLNYGVGERIQLTLQTAPTLFKRSRRGAVGGIGATEAALKWRFLDDAQNGASLSIFPRVTFNVLQSSVRRGLAEDGTRAQLPVQVEKGFGIFALGFEAGPIVSTIGRSEWIYGIVGSVELSNETKLMAELHGASGISFDKDALALNFGLRQTLTERCIFIGSVGHEVRAPDDDALAFIGYIGVQLLY